MHLLGMSTVITFCEQRYLLCCALSLSCLCRCSDETGDDAVDEHSGAMIPLVLTTDEPTKRPSLSVEHCSFLDSVISSQTGLPTIGSTPSACYSAANAAESFRLI